jgi:hypothetical protein
MGRVAYDPTQCARTHRIHYGSGMPVFRGEYRQNGFGLGSLLAGLARTVLPIITPIAKKFAKVAFSTGKDILGDVVSGKDTMKASARKRIREAVSKQLSNKRNSDIFG